MPKKSSRSGRIGTPEARGAGRTGAPRRAEPAVASRRPGPFTRCYAWLATSTGYAMSAGAVVALAIWARLVDWNWIFGSGRVELVPSDSHYYVRLARLQLEAGRPVPFDPFVGFPAGSENYWPHLHTLLVTIA